MLRALSCLGWQRHRMTPSPAGSLARLMSSSGSTATSTKSTTALRQSGSLPLSASESASFFLGSSGVFFDGMSSNRLLPPQAFADSGKLTVVVDLDETLVHSKFLHHPVHPGLRPPDAEVFVSTDRMDREEPVKVWKRPGVDEFLKQLRMFAEIILFTASSENYANPVADLLDPKGNIFRYRLYREHTSGLPYFIKDLSILGRSLRRTVLLDNCELSYTMQPDNGIPIPDYFGEEEEEDELFKALQLLRKLAKVGDVRPVVRSLFRPEAVEKQEGAEREEERARGIRSPKAMRVRGSTTTTTTTTTAAAATAASSTTPTFSSTYSSTPRGLSAGSVAPATTVLSYTSKGGQEVQVRKRGGAPVLEDNHEEEAPPPPSPSPPTASWRDQKRFELPRSVPVAARLVPSPAPELIAESQPMGEEASVSVDAMAEAAHNSMSLPRANRRTHKHQDHYSFRPLMGVAPLLETRAKRVQMLSALEGVLSRKNAAHGEEGDDGEHSSSGSGATDTGNSSNNRPSGRSGAPGSSGSVPRGSRSSSSSRKWESGSVDDEDASGGAVGRVVLAGGTLSRVRLVEGRDLEAAAALRPLPWDLVSSCMLAKVAAGTQGEDDIADHGCGGREGEEEGSEGWNSLEGTSNSNSNCSSSSSRDTHVVQHRQRRVRGFVSQSSRRSSSLRRFPQLPSSMWRGRTGTCSRGVAD